MWILAHMTLDWETGSTLMSLQEMSSLNSTDPQRAHLRGKMNLSFPDMYTNAQETNNPL